VELLDPPEACALLFGLGVNVFSVGLLIALVGCTAQPHPDGDDDDQPRDELDGYPTIGKDGQAGFGLEFGNCDRAIAEHATASLFAVVRKTAEDPATVTTDDPSILEVTKVKVSDDDPHFITWSTHAVTSGDIDLVIRDSRGGEIDRVTLHVLPTDTIAINRVWGSGPVRILAGAVERIHVTTLTNNVVTAGSGAVEFSVSGDLAPATAEDAPHLFSEGDDAFFTAGASGTGTITAAAPNATLDVDVAITQPSELTSIARSPESIRFSAQDDATVSVGAMVGNEPVFGATCTWTSQPAGLTIELGDHPFFGEQHGYLDSSPGFVYTLTGRPGSYTATCTMPNGLSTGVAVVVGS